MTCGLRPVEGSLPCGYVMGVHGALVAGIPGLKSGDPTARSAAGPTARRGTAGQAGQAGAPFAFFL
jgi:hypothetical protein